MNRIQTVVGSAIVASLFAIMPLAASADTLGVNGATGVVISPNGIVRVIGADVTAVSNGIVNAATTIGSTVINWIVNISAATKIGANGSANATTTDITAGDKVSFAGTVSSSICSTITVAASKIRDMTTFPKAHVVPGTITSIGSNGSFTLSHGDSTLTVNTTASTTLAADGATTAFSSLETGDRVLVAGTANADGSVITASKIVVKDNNKDKDDDDDDRGDHGKRASNGKNFGGFGGFFARFHLGKDD